MFDLDRLEEIWATIMRNRWRSFLTAMGVFWGVFMLVIMAGAGLGLERKLKETTGEFATNSCFFITEKTSEPYKGFKSARRWYFDTNDISDLKLRMKEVKYMTGMIFGWAGNTSYGDRKGSFKIMGHMPEYRFIEPQVMLYGRYINDIDIIEKRKSCLIGVQVYKELFPEGGNPVGKTIKVNDSYFTVIGVSTPSADGISIGGDPRRTLIIPYTTMQQMYGMGKDCHAIAMVGHDDVDISVVEESVKSVLRSRHNVSPTDIKAINSFNLKKQFDVFNNLFMGLNILTWVVGLGTLFAGVVGISNIMLVVIKERTSEIGVRRALGAKPLSIISQIMSESFVLTFVAGVAALGSGVGILSIADTVMNSGAEFGQVVFSPQISFNIAVGASVTIIIGGFMAGIVPAWRAISIKAVDAIREE